MTVEVELSRAQWRLLLDLRENETVAADGASATTIDALVDRDLAWRDDCGWVHLSARGKAATLLTGQRALLPAPARFVCGTRKVIRRGNTWRVVCATCEGGGTRPHSRYEEARKACVRDSNRPCRCGAS